MAQRLEERPFQSTNRPIFLPPVNVTLSAAVCGRLPSSLPLLPPVQVDVAKNDGWRSYGRRNSCVVNAKLMLAICPPPCRSAR